MRQINKIHELRREFASSSFFFYYRHKDFESGTNLVIQQLSTTCWKQQLYVCCQPLDGGALALHGNSLHKFNRCRTKDRVLTLRSTFRACSRCISSFSSTLELWETKYLYTVHKVCTVYRLFHFFVSLHHMLLSQKQPKLWFVTACYRRVTQKCVCKSICSLYVV